MQRLGRGLRRNNGTIQLIFSSGGPKAPVVCCVPDGAPVLRVMCAQVQHLCFFRLAHILSSSLSVLCRAHAGSLDGELEVVDVGKDVAVEAHLNVCKQRQQSRSEAGEVCKVVALPAAAVRRRHG